MKARKSSTKDREARRAPEERGAATVDGALLMISDMLVALAKLVPPGVSTAEEPMAGPGAARLIGTAAREIHHGGADGLVGLAVATERLYGVSKKRSEDGLHWAEWRRMLEVYRRTRGQAFVIEPSAAELELAGLTDAGPLFLWSALYRFAGCPSKGKRPTWRPPAQGYGVSFWGPGITTPRWWVTRLRAHVARAPRGQGAHGGRGAR